uniref:Uncharacterized protein n=1 Tax=Anguilla anguilla TaxID=7936 RepID=A0A0E9P5E7_ANGAN
MTLNSVRILVVLYRYKYSNHDC